MIFGIHSLLLREIFLERDLLLLDHCKSLGFNMEGVKFLRQIHEEVATRRAGTIEKAGGNRFPGHIEV